MYTGEIKRVNEICIGKLIDELGEDFVLKHEFKTEKPFIEYFNSNKDFAQISFSIRLEDRLTERNIRKNISEEECKLFEEKFKTINERLSEIQKEVAKEEFSSYDLRDYMSFASIGSSLGFCRIMVCHRNKLKEEEEQRLEIEEHNKRMKTDENYRKETQWLEEAYRPYGGAFDSLEDYYNHIS